MSFECLGDGVAHEDDDCALDLCPKCKEMPAFLYGKRLSNEGLTAYGQFRCRRCGLEGAEIINKTFYSVEDLRDKAADAFAKAIDEYERSER